MSLLHVRGFLQQHNSPNSRNRLVDETLNPIDQLCGPTRLPVHDLRWRVMVPMMERSRVDPVEGMEKSRDQKSGSGDLKVWKQGDVRRAMCFCLAGCKSKIVKLYQIVVSSKGKLQYTKNYTSMETK